MDHDEEDKQTDMLLKTSIALIATIAAWLGSTLPAAAFTMAVSPTRFEIPLGAKPVARSLKVINRGNEPMTVSIKVGHFDLDENSKVREIAPTPESLDQWIIIRPLKFTVPAGKTRTIRFAVRPYKRPSPGEHRAMIFLEQQGSHDKTRSQKSLEVRFRFGVAVYGQAGPAKHAFKVNGVKTDPTGFGLDIKNSGNAHVRTKGRYAVWPADRFPGESTARAQLLAADRKDGNIATPKSASAAGLLTGTPVLPGYRRTIRTDFGASLKPGRYRLVVDGAIAGRAIKRTTTFSVE